ncbi:zinc finger A20 and AN1 domain-containing stress-associated protein 4-like [Telopea speciosissima]|uniref:zinc finger A20 and AN1 domain-containing stress-associated protein 4-like n=1 Tax=Telopea speciosissima TaxID=54955 RepID=UPI001CC47748|nr:zinc finger A20 and AN1 domain-containing stress-associated protein 4-like [Telopea speciosissima]
MAEEHKLKAPEGHRLCANNCEFIGSPATLNLCSKCYGDLCLKEKQASSAKFTVEKSLAAASSPYSSSSLPSSSTARLSPLPLTLPTAETVDDRRAPLTISSATAVASPSELLPPPMAVSQPNRCSTCRKRVGLTGFKCRCGTIFCGMHRYPEQHSCTFDFKGMGREAIAKANPVVKAKKLEKI